jgi:hypothetical protein
VDAELEADRTWQELVVATYRLHCEVRALARAGRLSIDAYPTLSARLTKADAALDAWTSATEVCERQ